MTRIIFLKKKRKNKKMMMKKKKKKSRTKDALTVRKSCCDQIHPDKEFPYAAKKSLTQLHTHGLSLSPALPKCVGNMPPPPYIYIYIYTYVYKMYSKVKC